MTKVLLPGGSLRALVSSRSQHALTRGALHRIETRQVIVVDHDIPFMVRIVSSLRHKPRPSAHKAAPTNPFLPYERDLFVADITPGHVALLNKFNVLDAHLLIVTRAFEDQEALLNAADFTALWACMREYPALGFYNGGTVAGASQSHKHLQLVPLPLTDGPGGLPIGALVLPRAGHSDRARLAGLPFAHEFSYLPELAGASFTEAGYRLEQRYHALLTRARMAPVQRAGGLWQSAPYNLLLTREWMLLVPRTQECFADISLNALAFVGSLFVRTSNELATLQDKGPMTALRSVAR